MRSRRAAFVLLFALLAPLSPAAALPRCTGCDGCYAQACDARETCLQEDAKCALLKCLANRVPAVYRRCALTHDRIAECMAAWRLDQKRCNAKFVKDLRENCGCRISQSAARRGCQVCKESGASSTTTTTLAGTTSRPATTPAVTRAITIVAGHIETQVADWDECDVEPPFIEVDPAEDEGGCQRQCIKRIVGICYEDCRDKCEGDTLALRYCRQACRDGSCDRLEAQCTEGGGDSDDGDGEGSSRYQTCCDEHASCRDVVECEVTTSTTTTTRTTTTSTSTSSTTTTTTPF